MASAEFLVERSTVIDASPDVVQPLLDDFRKWQAWSPWEDVDPDLKRTYSGPDSGVGASYAWEGNRKAGSGQMVITESVPGSKVVLDLTFLKPFKAENVTTFLLEPNGAGTTVRWQMTGRNNLFFRIVGVVFPMDKMVGKDFEKGLAQLKAAAEQRQ
ncbi:SRPBCC family protein [Rhodococcus koreensis]